MNRYPAGILAALILASGLLAMPAHAQEAAVDEAAPAESQPTPRRSRPRQVDSLNLDATSIIGNRELPKVMYIVPWKDSDLGDLTGRPVNSLLDEVLSPLDRDVFRRQVSYFEQLYGDAEGTPGQ